jgi:pseudomonalisin
MNRKLSNPVGTALAAFFLLVLLNQSVGAQVSPMGQSPFMVRPRNRVVGLIDDEQRGTLVGSRHPLARPEFEVGGVKAEFRMEHVIMMLKPDAAQQKALENLLTAQHDPESTYYHQWLTPESYGDYFGISESDAARVVDWLQIHGLTVEEITAGRRSIIFSGSAQQIAGAFRTSIRAYRVGSELHHGNATDPQIPLALAGVVGGIASLHDFRTQPLHGELRAPVPAFTSGGGHYLAPTDFATIYNLGPLHQQALDGAGQSIAVVGRTNINLSDVRLFRATFGLAANDPQIILNGSDPGIVSLNEEVEADLDVQWSGAVARSAAIKFVVSRSTNSSDGAYLSAQYIVSHNLAPVMSMSFGLCEAALGPSGNSFLNSLWQQAAAQGITVLVSSGDSGAAGCDSSSAATATGGRAVNGLCSTPYSVCVGGTQFADTANPSMYWSSSNASGTLASALSYIPETVWNESGSGLWAAGGGASATYAKPVWQIGPGVPADARRDVPDVSLTSASHDGYLVFINGGLYVVGGTSAAAPSFAGLMALVAQSTAARQGNANPALYNLANKQASGGAAVFHDITIGNNGVPGVAGYTAGTGYDLATGLGSVDASALVTHWSDAITVPSFQVSASAGSISAAVGSTATVNLSSSVSGGFNAVVSLSVSGTPAGVTATLTPNSLPKPGSGSTALRLTVASTASPGTYSLTIGASSGGVSKSIALTLTILPAPNFALAGSQNSMTISPGGSAPLTLMTSVNAGFNAAIVLTVKNLPAGMTGTFSRSSIPASGSGSSTLTFAASSGVAAGAYTPVITATGGGITKTLSPILNVPGFTVSVTPSAIKLVQGGSYSVTLTIRSLAGFSSAVMLSVSGLPGRVTSGFSPTRIAAPGSGSSSLRLVASSSAAPGTYSLVVSAIAGEVTHTAPLALNIPGLSLTTSKTSVSIGPGQRGTVTVTPRPIAGFNSAVVLSVSDLPAGVTATLSPRNSVPGSVRTITLSRASANKTAGKSQLTIKAVGGGVTQTTHITLNRTVK